MSVRLAFTLTVIDRFLSPVSGRFRHPVAPRCGVAV